MSPRAPLITPLLPLLATLPAHAQIIPITTIQSGQVSARCNHPSPPQNPSDVRSFGPIGPAPYTAPSPFLAAASASGPAGGLTAEGRLTYTSTFAPEAFSVNSTLSVFGQSNVNLPNATVEAASSILFQNTIRVATPGPYRLSYFGTIGLPALLSPITFVRFSWQPAGGPLLGREATVGSPTFSDTITVNLVPDINYSFRFEVALIAAASAPATPLNTARITGSLTLIPAPGALPVLAAAMWWGRRPARTRLR